MENSIPNFGERECKWKYHSQFSGTGTKMKIPFPILGMGMRVENSIPDFWEREWDVAIPGNEREWVWQVPFIPDICHRHHRRCLCKFFLPGVNFSKLNVKHTECPGPNCPSRKSGQLGPGAQLSGAQLSGAQNALNLGQFCNSCFRVRGMMVNQR